ncbi:MAG: hypothetical protein PHN72_03355 [Bacilli bacterium]|nr:hypothetical protein [Bacilli bacterium]
MHKENQNNIFKEYFFLKLFGIPSVIWIIISLIAFIFDEADPDPLTLGELLLADIVILLIWFTISTIIVLIVNEIKRRNLKTKKFNNIIYSFKSNRKSKEEKKYQNSKFIKNGMILLFIMTILSVLGALYSFVFMNKINPQYGSAIAKNAWVFWCWLPVPIVSIILGVKYNKAGFKCIKNIVGGSIIGLFLFQYGFLCLQPTFSQDYNKINAYRNVIDADLPKNGGLEIQSFNTHFDGDQTECTTIDVYYSKEDTSDLEASIENGRNWVLGANIKSELKLFIPAQLGFTKDAYYSIYNKTIDRYNVLPESAGEYEIYAMRYVKSSKHLKIYKFKYTYK